MKEIKIFDKIIYYEVIKPTLFSTPIAHTSYYTIFYKKVIKKRKLFFALELIEWITGINMTTDYEYEELFTFPNDVEDKNLSKELKIEVVKRIASKIL